MPETLKCPFVPPEHPPSSLGLPRINPELCVGCGACVKVCPTGALQMIDDYTGGTRKIAFNVEKCTLCTRCEEVCPVEAVRIVTFEITALGERSHAEVVELGLHLCPGCGGYTDYTERALEKSLQMLSEKTFDGEEIRRRALLCRSCRRRLTVNEATKAGKEGM